MNINFNPMGFVENLPYMGIGMLGVFMIVGIIMAATYLIGKISDHKKDEDQNQ